MTTSTFQASAETKSGLGAKLVPIFFAAMLGLGMIAVTGHVQANTLHDAAHDARHATGFPCH